MTIRNALPDDLASILALNQTALPHVNALDIGDMERFLEQAAYFKVIGDLDGFLIGLKPGLDYGSDNYRWFSDAFDDFYYIDRIIISESARGQGLGSLLYKDIIESARSHTPRLTCEVNTRPANPQSMTFHQRFGFTPVGTQQTEGGTKEVTLLSLELIK
ncbi:MAG: GNAT family N-acetyltransferase [Rhodospirillaceae bacterium]|nr:GNAT family N-acetyltransferase [Rhodospirillaceae bacterium]MBT5244266.1 GNAT family N-acetyltransferase [Rhodospirillaceae bacterium]MBT5561791.1 GNAT family N-acetyltransferase [Rhodospirillaceae bacterium]MBT6243230.1 GNAT family N-acetyltransferase [Rhodospirillaceae bacterium]